MKNHQVLIIGGGTAGIMIASQVIFGVLVVWVFGLTETGVKIETNKVSKFQDFTSQTNG